MGINILIKNMLSKILSRGNGKNLSKLL